MLKKKSIRLLAAVCCLIGLAGCGSGDTNGSLALGVTSTAVGTGKYLVVATASYKNNTATALQNVPIHIRTSIHTLNGAAQVFEDDLSTDNIGEVTRTYNINQTTEDIFIDVTASTGKLSQSTTTSVPAGT